MSTKSQPEKVIFEQALDLTSSQERLAFLKGACGTDAAMMERLLRLVEASEGASAFLPEAPQAVATVKLDVPDGRDEAVGQTLGRYKLLERVGEGGCGVVYVAEQTEPVRRRVALKVIKLGMDTRQVVARFEAERQALAMMDHPNIAKVLDAGTTDMGRPFFVMELVRGIRITDYCDQAQLSTKARLDLFISVCHAIQHAHQKGIIHRDIKPSNILVTLHDGVPVPKVIDFGIAKATEGRLTDATVYTQLHQFIGTPAYMSPEQAEMSGLDIDTRSDIYSLGVLLYELLAGSTPFDAKELVASGIDQMRKTIREKEPPRPSTRLATLGAGELTTTAKRRSVDTSKLLHQLKGDLDWIVMKCLEKDRQRRYETANGLAADLKRHLNNEPVVARPPSTAYRLQKAFRRNKLVFTAAIAVAVALLLGFGVSTWQTFVARKAQRETEAARTGERQQRFEAQEAQKSAENERQRAEASAETSRNAAIQSRRSQYAADMFAATAEIEKGSYGNARNFLREYLPREGLEELRGFEWRYLWQLSAGQQLSIYPISGQVIDMAWSPDGGLIAAASSDRTVKLLHAATGEAKTIFENGSDFNVSVAFSHDGNGLAAAGLRSPVRFWDVRDGRLIFTLTNFVSARVACSPASPLMAVGTGGDWWGQRGGDVYLVDLHSGKEVRMLPGAGDRMAFSRDGKRLATANGGYFQSGQSVILWEVDSGQELHVLGNKRQVLGMAFSPDGNLLAIGTRHGDVTLWDLNDFTHSTLREATGDFARSLAFSPDGRWLAVAMLTQEVEIWDVENRRLVESLHGHTWEVNAVAYSPDGSQLASGCQDGTIRFWDPHPPTIQKLMPEVLFGQNMKAGLPTFSPDSRWMAAAVNNGDLHIVDTTTADWSARTVLPNVGLPMTFSGDASTLLTLESEARTLRRWNVASKALLSTTRLETTNVTWGYSSITPEGNVLALASNRGPIEIFETRSGRRLDRLERRGLVDSIELSRDGEYLAIGTGNAGVLWNIAAQRPMWTGKGHRDRVFSIKFSPDQKMIATASWDTDVRLWEVTTGKELAVLTGHRAAVLNCAFSPDGRTLASKSDDRTIKFWNLATFREVASISLDYTGNIQGSYLAFSPDGQILTANDGGPGLRCWRAPTLAEIDAAEMKQP
jgi:WD40 repeat protein/serine/threonine protein kinase